MRTAEQEANTMQVSEKLILMSARGDIAPMSSKDALAIEAALSTDAEPVKTAPAVAVKALQFYAEYFEKDTLGDFAREALSAQVQDVAGWRSMDSAPKDGSEFVAGRRYAPDGEFVVHTYKWVGEPNYWSSKRNGVCIRPQYQDDFVWCPLPASPASKHGDAE